MKKDKYRLKYCKYCNKLIGKFKLYSIKDTGKIICPHCKKINEIKIKITI